jgi:phenylacetate-coenzyme A ligase PaaK-like adenylate-forming protein
MHSQCSETVQKRKNTGLNRKKLNAKIKELLKVLLIHLVKNYPFYSNVENEGVVLYGAA